MGPRIYLPTGLGTRHHTPLQMHSCMMPARQSCLRWTARLGSCDDRGRSPSPLSTVACNEGIVLEIKCHTYTTPPSCIDTSGKIFPFAPGIIRIKREARDSVISKPQPSTSHHVSANTSSLGSNRVATRDAGPPFRAYTDSLYHI